MTIASADVRSIPGTPPNSGIVVDTAFITKVLAPYRVNCRYLRSVKIRFDDLDNATWETMVAIGEFAIDQSCYIDDTGHFNAVEFNICYNQLAYVHLAYCIAHGIMPALADFDADTFASKQLSNFLIANINSSYHAELNPRHFFGEVRVTSARCRSKYAILKTNCMFSDEANGRSDGDVKLVVLKP
jgi:hypothetical protein